MDYHFICNLMGVGFAAFYIIIGLICIPIYYMGKPIQIPMIIVCWPLLLLMQGLMKDATDYPADYEDFHS